MISRCVHECEHLPNLSVHCRSISQALNEQLMKSAEESEGMAVKLRDEHMTYIAEKENFALAIDGLNDDLIAIMSNSLGVCGQQKGYTDPKLDVAVLSAQVINANVTAPVYVLRYSFSHHRDSSNS